MVRKQRLCQDSTHSKLTCWGSPILPAATWTETLDSSTPLGADRPASPLSLAVVPAAESGEKSQSQPSGQRLERVTRPPVLASQYEATEPRPQTAVSYIPHLVRAHVEVSRRQRLQKRVHCSCDELQISKTHNAELTPRYARSPTFSHQSRDPRDGQSLALVSSFSVDHHAMRSRLHRLLAVAVAIKVEEVSPYYRPPTHYWPPPFSNIDDEVIEHFAISRS